MSSKISKTSKKQSSSPKKRNSSVPKCFAFLILLLSIFFFSRKGNQMTSTKDEISIPKKTPFELDILKTLHEFQSYKSSSLDHFKKSFERDQTLLSSEHRQLLNEINYEHYQKEILNGVSKNGEFLQTVVQWWIKNEGNTSSTSQNGELHSLPSSIKAELGHTSDIDYLFLQLIREWSIEGAKERENSFKPILDELESQYPNSMNRSQIKILVPGVGFRRLAWEISKLGFYVLSCEAHVMKSILFSFILTGISEDSQFSICPYLAKTGWIQSSDRVQCFSIPDEHPHASVNLQLYAGHFEEFNEGIGTWDCIISNFFLDTNQNLFVYFDAFHKLLKVNGLVINFGPLKFFNGAFALDFSHIQQILTSSYYNFEWLKSKEQNCTYHFQNRHTSQNIFNCLFFTAKKKS